MEIEAITVTAEEKEEDLMLQMPDATSLSGTASSSTAPVGGELGKQEFLLLLTTQLTHQDPLDPMNSTEMVAQLAQFSALEQMENLNSQFEAFREQSMIQAMFTLQGQSVALELMDGSMVEGKVEKIYWSNDMMQLHVAGEIYSFDKIAGITLLGQEDSEQEGTTDAVTAE